MLYYFCSKERVALKVNGVFKCVLTKTPTLIEINSACPLIEALPLDSTAFTLTFLLDEKFLTSPPENVRVIDLKGGYVITLFLPCLDNNFKVIAQEKLQNCLITVFNEKGYKISIETANDFHAEQLNFEINSAEIFTLKSAPTLVGVALYGEKITLFIFDVQSSIVKVFMREVDEFSCDNELTTIENFLDIAKHSLKINWEYNGQSFLEKTRTLTHSEEYCKESVNPLIIPYAFSEELAFSDSAYYFLDESLKKNADKLKGFFGEYVGVFPPPEFRDYKEVGFIYRKAENLYFAEYFTFELSNGKICGIKKV